MFNRRANRSKREFELKATTLMRFTWVHLRLTLTMYIQVRAQRRYAPRLQRMTTNSSAEQRNRELENLARRRLLYAKRLSAREKQLRAVTASLSNEMERWAATATRSDDFSQTVSAVSILCARANANRAAQQSFFETVKTIRESTNNLSLQNAYDELARVVSELITDWDVVINTLEWVSKQD